MYRTWGRLIVVLGVSCLLGRAGYAGTALYTAGQYNIFTLGNITFGGPDSVGAIAAGGNITVTGGTIASGYAGSGFPYWAVVAGGTLTAQNRPVIDGNIHAKAESGTFYDNMPHYVNTVSSTPVIDFADTFKKVESTSSYLFAKATTSGDSCTSAYGTLTCTATKSGLNVINVNASLLSNTNLRFNMVSGATLVINVIGTVAGTTYTLGSGSYGFDVTDKRALLFNFSATSLQLAGTINASVLAPYANVTVKSGTSGQFTGNLIANSYNGTGLEFENQLFNGYISPEPATWGLLGGGLLAMGAVARRRQKRQ
jgi:choice-of-anchor A domain-containing protein